MSAMTTDTKRPMHCALCNKAYPWTEDYWPSLTWAECFRCWKKSADEQVRAAHRAKWLYEHQWMLLPLGMVAGAILMWWLKS